MSTPERTPMSGFRILLARELRANLRSALSWMVPVAGLLALTCALQPSFAGNGGLLEAKIQAMPEAMRRGLGLALVDFQRPAAYLAANFLFVSLTGALFAALLGAGVVAREETLHTAELLYAQPVSRAQVLAGKAAAVALYALAFPLAMGAVAVPILAAVAARPVEPGLMIALFAGAAAVNLAFAGAGMLAAALVREPRSAAGVALALALGTYFVGVISAIAATAAPLRWLSPYKLVEPAAVVARGGLDPVAGIALVGLGLALVAAAIAGYRRRDLHA